MHRICNIVFFVVCLAVFSLSSCLVSAQQTEDLEYTQEEIQNTSTEAFLERMAVPEPGYHKFAAMHALTKKAKVSDVSSRKSIMAKVVATMNNKALSEFKRWQCCYVISDCGDEKWVPELVDVLMKDPSPTMRAVAAEALGKFKTSSTARDALRLAAGRETEPRVLEVIQRVLTKTAGT